jgi:hypothetical protein
LREAATVRLFIGRPQKNAAIAFSPDGKYLAFFDGDAIVVNDIGAVVQVVTKQIMLHTGVHLSFSMDSRFVYAVGQDGEVVLCEVVDDGKMPKEILHQNERVVAAEMMAGNQLKIIVSQQV